MNLEYERPLRLIHLGHFQLNFTKLLTKDKAIRIHQKNPGSNCNRMYSKQTTISLQNCSMKRFFVHKNGRK